MTEFLIVAALLGTSYAAIVLDHAHLVSPIALAWSKARFRRHMLARPAKFFALPALCLGVAVGIGLTSARHSLAFDALVLVYWWWNLIHFAMQNYGLMRMIRARGWLAEAAGVATAFTLAILPWALPGPWVLPLLVGINWGHWITDIALSTSRMGRWMLFLAAVLIVGSSGFLFKEVSTKPFLCQGFAACTRLYSDPFWLSLRLGLGFVHYLYSRWDWQSWARPLLAA